MRAGLELGGSAGPISLSTLLDRERDRGGIEGPMAAGGGAGPSTLRRLSLDSGLAERSSSSSRVRFVRCGGSDGPIGMLVVCDVDRAVVVALSQSSRGYFGKQR